jgi:hypothetical protein
LEQEELIGPVKSVKYRYYCATSDGDSIKKEFCEWRGIINTDRVYNKRGFEIESYWCGAFDDVITSKTLFTRNAEEQIVETSTYSLPENILIGTAKNTYDDNGSITTITGIMSSIYYKFEKDSSKTYHFYYTYNKQDLLIKKVNQGYSEEYVYNEQGLLVNTKYYNDKDSLTREVYFKHNNKGQVVEKRGDNFLQKFTLNSSGSIIESITWVDNWETEKFVREFDEQNRMIKYQKAILTSKGEVWVVTNYEYEEDIWGNWVVKRTIHNGRLTYIDERTIEYY